MGRNGFPFWTSHLTEINEVKETKPKSRRPNAFGIEMTVKGHDFVYELGVTGENAGETANFAQVKLHVVELVKSGSPKVVKEHRMRWQGPCAANNFTCWSIEKYIKQRLRDDGFSLEPRERHESEKVKPFHILDSYFGSKDTSKLEPK